VLIQFETFNTNQ